MLEQLFGSKTRVKLLRLFLNNANQPYYLRELARLLKTQLNSVRREVANLEKLGIIKSVELDADAVAALHATGRKAKSSRQKSSGLKKYYLTDTEFILYPELKALLLKAQVLLEKDFVNKVVKMGKLKLFILTGVFVGIDDASTDILLVGSIERKKIGHMVKRFERELDRPINYTVLSPQEFKYRHDITDRFLYDILEGRKIVVVNELL